MFKLLRLRREYKRELKAGRLRVLAAKARSDYRSWLYDDFESSLASLILRIGRFDAPLRHHVTVDEVRAEIYRLTGHNPSFARTVDFMQEVMAGEYKDETWRKNANLVSG